MDSDSEELQKLAIMINFLLEKARRTVSSLEEARHGLQEEVAARTRELNLVLNGSNDGVWIWDLDTSVLKLSSRWLQQSGLPSDNSTYSPGAWLDRVHPKDIDNLKAAIRGQMACQDTLLRCEYRLRHEDGGYRWMLCRGLCERDQNGAPTMIAGTQSDITERRNIDRLTSLPNENVFHESVEDLIDSGSSFHALLVSIDKFAKVQETLDTDDVIAMRRAIGARLSDALPQGAILTRFPGDVFGAVIPTDRLADEACAAICEEVVALFAEPFQTEGVAQEAWLGASVGGLPHSVAANMALSKEIAAGVRSAMRQSQRTGGACYHLYNAALRERARAEMQTEQDVRVAVRDGGIVPYFQPILCCHGRDLRGFEALVRMRGADGAMVPPGAFLPVAQESSLIVDIGDIVLEKALEQLSEWRRTKEIPMDAFMSVNIDAKQIDEKLIQKVEAALARHKVPAGLLKIEMTETAVITDFDRSIAICKRLKGMGVKVALDDFGTGYSSLSYLRRLPVDMIKIDRSFVTGIHAAAEKRAIVETILHLSAALNLEVIAEGVEELAELAVLRELDVPLVQGFLFAKPLPGAEILEHIALPRVAA